MLIFTGSHNVSGEKPPSSVRLPAPKSPARDGAKNIGAETGEAPSPPEGSYGGYHLSYEVKKLM